MPDPTLRLRYYQETGQTDLAKQYEKYLRETGQFPGDGPDTPPPIDYGISGKALGAAASLVRDIPGVEAAQAGIRAAIDAPTWADLKPSNFGAHYREALSDIRGAEDAAPAVATVPARLLGAGLSTAALPGGASLKGAQFGALSGALSSDPNTGLASRGIQAGVGAAAGAALPSVLSKVGQKTGITSGGSRILDAIRNRAALRSVGHLDLAEIPEPTPMQSAGIPRARPVVDAPASAPEPTTPAFKPRGRTQAQLSYFADQFAKKQAEQEAIRAAIPQAQEPDLEALLAASLKGVKQGNTLNNLTRVMPFPPRIP
jgi:hypothetical protein